MEKIIWRPLGSQIQTEGLALNAQLQSRMVVAMQSHYAMLARERRKT